MIAVVRLRTEASIHWQKRFGKSQAGTLRMASISATPKETIGVMKTKERDVVLYFDESELLEWSFPMGSNRKR
jgi:hypothetical protein